MNRQLELLQVLRLLKPHSSRFGKVRVGAMGDGGYVLPDDLAGIRGVVSLGIGDNVSFDSHFARQGIPIYQYDPSVEGPPYGADEFHFHKTAWTDRDEEGSSTLSSIVARHNLADAGDYLLKFDTEGSEWDALQAMNPDLLKSFRVIACELHGLHGMYDPQFLSKARNALLTLTHSHTTVHLHVNNCCGIALVEGIPVPQVVEVTLLRNDRSEFTPSTEPIPGPLDFPNMTDRPDIIVTPFG